MTNDKKVNVTKGKKGFQPVTSGKKTPVAPNSPHTIREENFNENNPITTKYEQYTKISQQSNIGKQPDYKKVQTKSVELYWV